MCHVFFVFFVGFPLVIGVGILYEKIFGEGVGDKGWYAVLFAAFIVGAVVIFYFLLKQVGCLP